PGSRRRRARNSGRATPSLRYKPAGLFSSRLTLHFHPDCRAAEFTYSGRSTGSSTFKRSGGTSDYSRLFQQNRPEADPCHLVPASCSRSHIPLRPFASKQFIEPKGIAHAKNVARSVVI